MFVYELLRARKLFTGFFFCFNVKCTFSRAFLGHAIIDFNRIRLNHLQTTNLQSDTENNSSDDNRIGAWHLKVVIYYFIILIWFRYPSIPPRYQHLKVYRARIYLSGRLVDRNLIWNRLGARAIPFRKPSLVLICILFDPGTVFLKIFVNCIRKQQVGQWRMRDRTHSSVKPSRSGLTRQWDRRTHLRTYEFFFRIFCL